MLRTDRVRIKGVWYNVTADVPGECNHVWNAMLHGAKMNPERLITNRDLQEWTNKSSADVKMRKLYRLNRTVFIKAKRQSDTCNFFYGFRINPKAMRRSRVQGGGR